MTNLRSAKVCVLGDFSVGKTSTISRFVRNEFSEKYQTTVGVKIDVREVTLDSGDTLKLIFWDLAGSDDIDHLQQAYLRGAAGYLLVADGTRRETLGNALELHKSVQSALGALPFVALVNKSDLEREWEVGDDEHIAAQQAGVDWQRCSAKSGDNVDEAIRALARAIGGR